MISTIGSSIQEARKGKGLTQKQLADRLELSSRMIQKYEGGIVTPSIAQLKRLSSVLGLDFKILLSKGALLDGVYTHEELHKHTGTHVPLSPGRIADAYEKATPPVQRIVKVALEPFMDEDE